MSVTKKKPFQKYNTREQWKNFTLGNFVEEFGDFIVDGDWVESDDMDDSGSVKMIQLGNLKENTIVGPFEKRVTRDWCNENDVTILQENDVITARMPEPIFRSAVITEAYAGEYIVPVDIMVIRGLNHSQAQYISQFMNSHFAELQGESYASGSTRDRISRKNAEKIGVPVPPVEVQERIVSLLSDVNSYIEKSEQRLERLQKKKQAIYQKAFGNDGGVFKDETGVRIAPAEWSRFNIPDDWDTYNLGNSCSIQTGNGFKSKYFNSNGDGWPLVKRATVNGTEDEPTYTTEDFNEKYIVEEGDVLVSMDGNFEVKIWSGKKSVLNQRVCKITPETTNINAEYLGYVLQPIVKQCEHSTGGTTVPSLSNKKLNDIMIPVPDSETQEKISSLLSEVNIELSSTRTDIESMREQKKGLLQEIFSG